MHRTRCPELYPNPTGYKQSCSLQLNWVNETIKENYQIIRLRILKQKHEFQQLIDWRTWIWDLKHWPELCWGLGPEKPIDVSVSERADQTVEMSRQSKLHYLESHERFSMNGCLYNLQRRCHNSASELVKEQTSWCITKVQMRIWTEGPQSTQDP